MTLTLDTARITDSARDVLPAETSYDLIVIGSGAGGAVLAKEAAEGGMKVAIVEEGGVPPTPRDSAYESFLQLYRDSGFTNTMGKPFIPIPLGKCLGGTTTINSGTCFRTPASILARWREEFGLTDLEPALLDKAFDRVEREIHVAPADFAVMSRANTIVHELLLKEGVQGAPLRRNALQCEGCGMCCYGCTSGAKQSMDRGYIPKALSAGARAYVHSRAEKVVFDRQGHTAGLKVQPVDAQSRPTGSPFLLHAPRVAVACGTMLSPAFLKRNRIARGNPHLGKHLAIHPASKVVAEFDERIDCWDGIPQAYYCDVLHDDGIMFEGVTMPPGLGPTAVPFHGKMLAHYIGRYSNMASFGFMISDTTEGHMRWLPGTGYQFFYSLTETDVRRIRRAISFLARIFLKGGAKRVYAMVSRVDNQFTTLEDVDRFEQTPMRGADFECMAFHPLGTCRMATSPAMGVCDQHHEVFGTPGLYLCDGSVVPTALGVNPQETIMGMATRLAGIFLNKTLD